MSKASVHSTFVVPAYAPAPGRRSTLGTLRRIARMPWSEIAGRTRQQTAKVIDRVTSFDRPIDPDAILREHAPALADPKAAMSILREAAPARFFAGVENLQYDALAPAGQHEEVVSRASAVLQRRFDLLGYRTLWFGDPIDWHLDPVCSRRAPRVHWTRLNPLDPAEVGDSKVVWELNRHQWVARLAHAYVVTGDERYAESGLAAIESWIEANPYGIGVNWSSSLEVAYRLISWSWALLLLRHSAALSGQRLTGVMANVWLHANHVARYLSFFFSPNTHLTGEALGLFYAGSLFAEFKSAQRWQRLGARVLIAESRSQICPDGVHFERSTCYHRYTVETYQQFLLLAARNRVPVPDELGDEVRRMSEYLLAVRRPDGMLPEIGDADGGRLLPLVERHQCDPRGVLAVSAAMFGRGDFADAGGPAPEVAWLMGEAGADALAAVAHAKPAGEGSRVFPSGGYAVMRSGWERDAHQMIVDVGPLGCSLSAGHGHADLLSVQCSAFGEPILVDPGTFCYTPADEWRNFFRGTAAHSTVMIGGRSQAEPDGPFGWRGRPAAQLHEWRSTGECDFVDARHGAYPGVVHQRRVMFVKPDYWVIVDDVREEAGRAGDVGIELGFQFAPMEVSAARDGWARALTPAGNTFWVGVLAPAAIKPHVACGELTPVRGWVSADYGQRTPAPRLAYATNVSLPWRSITLLLPYRGARASVPAVSALFDDHNLPIGLGLEERRESVFVDDTDFFLSRDL